MAIWHTFVWQSSFALGDLRRCVCCALIASFFAAPAFGQQDVVRFDEQGHEIRLGVGRSMRTKPAERKQPWTFQLKKNVQVQSSVVRIADVVVPISIPENKWLSIGKSTIGLVPTDGRPLRLMRYRLAEALSQSQFVDSPILWVGPESTTVRSAPVIQEAMANGLGKPSQGQLQSLQNTGGNTPQGSVVPASFQLTKASGVGVYGKRLIERAVAHAMREAKDVFTYTIDWEKLQASEVDGIRSFQRVAVPDKISDGVARFVLSAQVGKETRHVPVYLSIESLPRGVVAASGLRRGQILNARDLKMKAIPENTKDENFARDPSTLIGMEVKNNIPEGRWVEQSDVGMPILVQRNDIVEIVVAGGAVVVRTGGKALAAGAEGELVQVETLDGRKRLIARVIASGQVEIVTRAPQVSR